MDCVQDQPRTPRVASTYRCPPYRWFIGSDVAGVALLIDNAHGGHLDLVKLLIARGAPLEVKNSYGGTVLGQALWSAFNAPCPDHLAIVETLIAAGANAESELQRIEKLRAGGRFA